MDSKTINSRRLNLNSGEKIGIRIYRIPVDILFIILGFLGTLDKISVSCAAKWFRDTIRTRVLEKISEIQDKIFQQSGSWKLRELLLQKLISTGDPFLVWFLPDYPVDFGYHYLNGYEVEVSDFWIAKILIWKSIILGDPKKSFISEKLFRVFKRFELNRIVGLFVQSNAITLERFLQKFLSLRLNLNTETKNIVRVFLNILYLSKKQIFWEFVDRIDFEPYAPLRYDDLPFWFTLGGIADIRGDKAFWKTFANTFYGHSPFKSLCRSIEYSGY